MAAFPTSVATDSDLYVAVNATSTQLSDNPLTVGATTVNVVSAAAFPTVGFISIDNEIIKYTGKTATSFTGCTRGADGTAAASHVQNSQVFHNVIAAHHNAPKDEIIATQQFIDTHIGRSTAVVAAEFERLSGVTSAIQTQINGRALVALSNLSGVAINTSLISDTNNTDDLGSSAIGWKDLYLTGSLKNGSAIGVSVDTTGRVSKPNQPSFNAYASATTSNVTGAGSTVDVIFDTENSDVGNNYDSSTGVFTAPITGKYIFTAGVNLLDIAAASATDIQINLVTTGQTYSQKCSISATSTVHTAEITRIVSLTAGQTAKIQVSVSGSSAVVDIQGSGGGNVTNFSGIFLG